MQKVLQHRVTMCLMIEGVRDSSKTRCLSLGDSGTHYWVYFSVIDRCRKFKESKRLCEGERV